MGFLSASPGTATAERGRDGQVAFLAYKPCTKQSIIARPQPDGSVMRTVLPRDITQPALAPTGDDFSLAWSARGTVFSAALTRGVLGRRVPEGPAPKFGGGASVQEAPGGARWVVWDAPDGVRARYSDAAGQQRPAVLVAAGDDFFPKPLGVMSDGSIWIGLSGLIDTDAAYARRISATGQAGPQVQIFRSREQLAYVSLERGSSDGHGGVLAAVVADDDFSGEMDPSAQLGFSTTVYALHLDASGRAAQRIAAEVDGALLTYGVEDVGIRSRLTYQSHDRRHSVITRSFGPSLGASRRLPADGRLDAFAVRPGTDIPELVLRRRSGSRARLRLQRFDRRGRLTRSVTIARTGNPTADRVEFGPNGRTYVAWHRSVPGRGSEAFIRMVRRVRAAPSRRLWRCRPRR